MDPKLPRDEPLEPGEGSAEMTDQPRNTANGARVGSAVAEEAATAEREPPQGLLEQAKSVVETVTQNPPRPAYVFEEGVVVELWPEGLRIRVVDYHSGPVILSWEFLEERLKERGKLGASDRDVNGTHGSGI